MIQTQMRSPSPGWFMGWLALIVVVILLYLGITAHIDRKDEAKRNRQGRRR